MRFLVTAGNTRESIDQVRDWGNIFTGNTGFAIARAMAELGEVDLLSSNHVHLASLPELSLPHAIRGRPFTTHAELRALLAEQMASQSYDAVFMTAAVADYKPVRTYRVISREPGADGQERWVVQDVQAPKVTSTHGQIAVLAEKTEKLVDLFRSEWGYRGLLVKFKLEVGRTKDELIEIGQQSRVASGADYLVANTLDMVGGSAAGAYLIGPEEVEWVARANLPQRLRGLVERPIRHIIGN